ncbi:MAG: cytochrome c1 [Steroidobacteraceae bacterium]
MSVEVGLRMLLGLVLTLLCGASAAWAAGTQTSQPPLRHMTVDLNDQAALRTGALQVMTRCVSCHGVQGSRYVELAGPLGLTTKQVQRFLDPSGRRLPQTIVTAMPPQLAKLFFHTVPPDLTVIAKRYSADWLYTYLTSFYLDPTRPTGVNNVVVYNVAMPDVFAGLQGLQSPVKKLGLRFGSRKEVAVGVKPLTAGTMSPAQFDRTARDIVSFLYLLAHPHQQERHAIGPWILGLFGLLSALSYALYRLYWRQVVRPHGPRWWHYWRQR